MITPTPLTWPADKNRTPAEYRERALFNKKVQHPKNSYRDKIQLSVADGIARIKMALNMYTRVGKDFRIPEETIIISTNLPVGKKGAPLSNLAEPDDPGAAVYFTLDGVNYCLPCDKWNRVADNLGAIAAHIEALRSIERWGVGTSKDVYTGFKALPEPAKKRNWHYVLDVNRSATPAEIKAAYYKLAKKYHPDNMITGDAQLFREVNEAYEESTIK